MCRERVRGGQSARARQLKFRRIFLYKTTTSVVFLLFANVHVGSVASPRKRVKCTSPRAYAKTRIRRRSVLMYFSGRVYIILYIHLYYMERKSCVRVNTFSGYYQRIINSL